MTTLTLTITTCNNCGRNSHDHAATFPTRLPPVQKQPAVDLCDECVDSGLAVCTSCRRTFHVNEFHDCLTLVSRADLVEVQPC